MTIDQVLGTGSEPGSALQSPCVPPRDLGIQEPDLGAGQAVGAEGLPLTVQPHAQHPLRLVLWSAQPRPTPFSLSEGPKVVRAGLPSLRVQLRPLIDVPPRQGGKDLATGIWQLTGPIGPPLLRKPLSEPPTGRIPVTGRRVPAVHSAELGQGIDVSEPTRGRKTRFIRRPVGQVLRQQVRLLAPLHTQMPSHGLGKRTAQFCDARWNEAFAVHKIPLRMLRIAAAGGWPRIHENRLFGQVHCF